MPQKRIVRLVAYEGIDSWVDEAMRRIGEPRTIFNKAGTIKELQRVELGDGEQMVIKGAKVGDIIEGCSDSLIREAAEERGYTVIGDDDSDEAIAKKLHALGIFPDRSVVLSEGWRLWRMNDPRFAEWLREFFWEEHGRNP